MTLSPLETFTVVCPYCGERLICECDTLISHQRYIEDCHICCAPIVYEISIDHDNDELNVSVKQDND